MALDVRKCFAARRHALRSRTEYTFGYYGRMSPSPPSLLHILLPATEPSYEPPPGLLTRWTSATGDSSGGSSSPTHDTSPIALSARSLPGID